MKTRRIHITGASGAGVTTTGRALADRLGLSHHDSDDFFWCPTSPPYRHQRSSEDRLRLMEEMFLGGPDWVLSGSVAGWAESVTPHFDLVVFLATPTDVRLTRLRDRETRRFGRKAVGPGGWRHAETEDFIDWASHYDDGSREGRSLAIHEAWLETATCPILRCDGARPTAELVDRIVHHLSEA